MVAKALMAVSKATRRSCGGNATTARRSAPRTQIHSSRAAIGTSTTAAPLTDLATRNAAAITSAFTVNEYDGTTGRAVVSTEDPASWIPGRTWTSPTVTAPQTIGSTRHSIVDGKLRTEVLGNSPESDPVIGPLSAMIQDLAPDCTYAACWEYSVVSVNAGAQTIDCSPTSTAVLSAPFPLPAHVTGVPMVVGVAGTVHTPAEGSVVLLCFANSDPSKPRIVAYDGTQCSSVKLNGGGHKVALADDVASQLSAIASALTSHVHSGVTTGSGVSGTAASVYTPGNVASATVESA